MGVWGLHKGDRFRGSIVKKYRVRDPNFRVHHTKDLCLRATFVKGVWRSGVSVWSEAQTVGFRV